MWFVALAVVLGLALVGAVVALIVTERRNRPPKPVAPAPAVVGRESLDVIDAGLKRLTGESVRAGRPLPDLYAVVYSEERLGLLLAGAEKDAPRPWTVEEDGERWSVAPQALQGRGTDEQALPYALTVTVGLGGPDRVLVDLSRASATISVAGPDEEVRSFARAVITEVVTGPVGGSGEVTLVGSLANDTRLNGNGMFPSGLHTAADLEEGFARTAGARDTQAPEAADVTQVFRLIEGHSQASVPGESPQLFVIEATQLPRRKEALNGLRRGDALLVLGEAPAGWRWRAGEDGSLDTGPLGLDVSKHAGRM